MISDQTCPADYYNIYVGIIYLQVNFKPYNYEQGETQHECSSYNLIPLTWPFCFFLSS